MKVKAEAIKKGDEILIAGAKMKVIEVEKSEIGKQGVSKCRIVAENDKGEKTAIIRPSDYPIETSK